MSMISARSVADQPVYTTSVNPLFGLLLMPGGGSYTRMDGVNDGVSPSAVPTVGKYFATAVFPSSVLIFHFARLGSCVSFSPMVLIFVKESI